MTGSGMSGLLTMLGEIFTEFVAWAGDIGEAIVSTPILALGFGIFVTGAAIGLFGRLLSRG